VKREVKIGIIVAFGIAALIWGVPFLKGTALFSNQKKVFAIYNRVDGLVASNPVHVNGLKVGQVTKMNLMEDRSGRILVTMVVDGDLGIPRNSTAVIVSSDILGSKAIQINYSKEKETISNKDTLKSDIQLSITEEVTQQVAPIRQKTEHLLTSMDSLITVVHSVLNAKTRENLIKTFESVKHTIETLEQATVKVDALVTAERNRLSNIFANVESISQNLKDNNEQISVIIRNFSAISDTIAKAQLAATLRNTNKTLGEMSSIFTKLNKGQGSLGLLLNNDSLYHGLSASADNLNRLILDLKERPGRYVQFSVFGGGGGKKKEKPAEKK
jgi:phospholipid/cholesterol/gamma-HCH transport system substrate-binding protein